MKHKTIKILVGVFVGVIAIIGIFLLIYTNVNPETIFTKIGNGDVKSVRFSFSQTPYEGGMTAEVNTETSVLNVKEKVVQDRDGKKKNMNINMWSDGVTNYAKFSGNAVNSKNYANKWLGAPNRNDDGYPSIDNISTGTSAIKDMAGTSIAYDSKNFKKFKARRTWDGYVITYDGDDKGIWDDTMNIYTSITKTHVGSMILKTGDKVTRGKTKVEIRVNRKYHLTYVKQDISYYVDNDKVTWHFKLDNFNKYNNLQVPYYVKENVTPYF